MKKWITPVALSLSVMGAVAAPAMAQDPFRYLPRVDITRPYDSGYYDAGRYDSRYYDRYDGNRRYDRFDDGTFQRYGFRVRRQGMENDNRRAAMAERAVGIRQRAEELYNRGNLSREHYNRVNEKLDRVRTNVNRDRRIDTSQYQADMEWMSGIERDMENWTRSGRRMNRDGFRRNR